MAFAALPLGCCSVVGKSALLRSWNATSITEVKLVQREGSRPMRGPIVRRIAFLLAGATGLAAHTDGALADTGPCQSMEYERAGTLSARSIFVGTRSGFTGTGQMGPPMRIFLICRAIWKAAQAGCYSLPTPACSTRTSSRWACMWNRGRSSCTLTPSRARAIST
jgi:hypothetical protein